MKSPRTGQDTVGHLPRTIPVQRSYAAQASAGTLRRTDTVQVMLPKSGMQFPGNLPFETWLRIGHQLSAVGTSSAWCLGDWLVYGETAYKGRYRDATEQTSLDYQTLRNYAWVARRFILPRRRDTLSFGHHAEVASLSDPEQDFWLRKAEELGWSRNRLRREVRASLKERSAVTRAEENSVACAAGERISREALRIQVEVTLEQLKLLEQAARSEGLSIEVWAATIIERAARKHIGSVQASMVAR